MLFNECGYVSLNKVKEELCGDKVEIINRDDAVTMVLADGLGSGVKANILSTLTSKIVATMTADGLPVNDAVATIAQTLPVCSERKVAYSTFTLLKAKPDGKVSLVQYDNPSAILLRDGSCIDYDTRQETVYGKNVLVSEMTLQEGDMMILLSDGVEHAGVGMLYNFGWQLRDIKDFVSANYSDTLTAKGMAVLLAGACRQLYGGKPGDDATVAVLRVREDVPINIMTGPPADKVNDTVMADAFFASEGKKVVCGGTTSHIAARYLNVPITTSCDYVDPNIPPIAHIEGVDLTTEGVLTLGRVLELCDAYRSADVSGANIKGRDGASVLAKMLLEEATTIRFFAGRAINPAHQSTDFPSQLSIKLRLVNELAESLTAAGKKVTVRYF